MIGVLYIYLYNDNLIYCGKDSNFPSRLNYHKIYDKNILSLIPQHYNLTLFISS